MKHPSIAARIDPALLELVRSRYGFTPGTGSAVVIRFCLAVMAGKPDPVTIAYAPIGHPRKDQTS